MTCGGCDLSFPDDGRRCPRCGWEAPPPPEPLDVDEAERRGAVSELVAEVRRLRLAASVAVVWLEGQKPCCSCCGGDDEFVTLVADAKGRLR